MMHSCSVLAHRSPGAHVQALLSDDDVDAAWAALAQEKVLASAARHAGA